MQPSPSSNVNSASGLSRRGFVGASLAATAVPLLGTAAMAVDKEPLPKLLKIGVIGCGGRGSWIAKLFQKHGGYEIVAVADYFAEVAEKGGEALGVPAARCFSGLAGYKRVIDSGIEALVVKVPTCFIAEQAAAAVEAGLHVYTAKPIAVDVPSCLKFLEMGKKATAAKRVAFVDYQIPTDPANQEVAEMLQSGKLGEPARVVTVGVNGGRPDPVKTANIESRLRNLVWDNDIAIGGGYVVSYDIHAIDAAVWALKRRPAAAMGRARVIRPQPHGGDSPDVFSVVYEYADGLIHEHFSQALPNRMQGELSCKVYTYNAQAIINYWGKAAYEIRGQKRVEKPVENLYDNGAMRNIATFHELVTNADVSNTTVPRAVDGCLACILGREAALRKREVTMDDLLKENKRIEPDRRGLKE